MELIHKQKGFSVQVFKLAFIVVFCFVASYSYPHSSTCKKHMPAFRLLIFFFFLYCLFVYPVEKMVTSSMGYSSRFGTLLASTYIYICFNVCIV